MGLALSLPQELIVMRMAMVCIAFILVVFGACSSDKEGTVTPALSAGEKEDVIKENCETLRQALEGFAAEKGGYYPRDVWMDTTYAGKALIDLLPGRHLLLNPFTGEATEPGLGTADSPGEIRYSPRGNCLPWGYWITGFGADSLIQTLTNQGAIEDTVRANCSIVQAAVEEFAALNGGEYPADVDDDETPGGLTLIDLLPGGMKLWNPMFKTRWEPTDYWKHCNWAGSVAYRPVKCYGICTGYHIYGIGVESGLVILELVMNPPCLGGAQEMTEEKEFSPELERVPGCE